MIERFKGALLGCAVGDALGAPYEGYPGKDIPPSLINDFGDFDGYPKGQYTDDTQLTIATVQAILNSQSISPKTVAKYIGRLWETAEVIGPGGACLEAGDNYLRTKNWKTCGAPKGRAGNGAAMRTAFLGLLFPERESELVESATFISRLTHHDPRAVAGGVAIPALVHSLIYNSEMTNEAHLMFVAKLVESVDGSVAQHIRDILPLLDMTGEEAVEYLAWPDESSRTVSFPIITPYVLPTILASFWAVLKHLDSWHMGVEIVIRLGGDVDTLGAIVGAILGARLGSQSIPENLLSAVQNSVEISQIAKSLYDLSISGLKLQCD